MPTEAESIVQLGYIDQLLFETVENSGVYLEIEEMTDFPPFGGKASLVDVTHRRSPRQEIERIATFTDRSELAYAGNYHPTHAVQTAVRNAERTKRRFKYVINDELTGTPLLTQSFEAWILSFMTESPMQSGRKFALTLQPSGELTEV